GRIRCRDQIQSSVLATYAKKLDVISSNNNTSQKLDSIHTEQYVTSTFETMQLILIDIPSIPNVIH
ncbi:MAG: hypothetical protein AAGJ57_08950, partial [Pseudomonadota bacterium]